MIVAVLSDIHANWEALSAVDRELAMRRPDRVYHLGDLVGYNADGEKCVQWAIGNTDAGIMGNHDAVASGKEGGERFNPPALIAARWSKAHLTAGSKGYLAALPARLEAEGGFLLVHGAPSDPDRYVFTLDDAVDEMDAMPRESYPAVVFFGHTHLPAAYVRGENGDILSVWKREVRLGKGETAMLNPGSVGQPRDRNPLASFLVFDTDTRVATWVRVPYDIETCRKKVLAAGLPRFFAMRLAEGT